MKKEDILYLLDDKTIALTIEDDVVRYSYDIGNDESWKEIEIDGRSLEEIVALINTARSKETTGKVNQL